MIEASSRFAYTRRIRREDSASAVFTIEITGVMPLPPAMPGYNADNKGFVEIMEFAKICFNIKEKKGKD